MWPSGNHVGQRVFAFAAALFVVPLVYLSGLRLVSQFLVPTDVSSLWETPLPQSLPASPSMLAGLGALDPLTADYPYLLAGLVAGEDTAEALRLNSKAVRLSVLSPRHWVQRGWLEAQTGNFRGALVSFEKALFLDPRDVDSHVQKGLFLFFHVLPRVELSRKTVYLAMAEQSLSLATQYDPSLLRNPSVAFALASIYNDEGDRERARKILARADDSAPQDIRFLVKKWALSLELGDTQRLVSQWNLLVQEERFTAAQLGVLLDEIGGYADIPDFGYLAAKIHLARGETSAALQKLGFCVSGRPHVAEYRIALGDIYENIGQLGAALAQYEKALQLSPANQHAKAKVIEYYTKKPGTPAER